MTDHDLLNDDYYRDEIHNTNVSQALELINNAPKIKNDPDLVTEDIISAVQCYRKSISLFPTPEAYTYLGWMYSLTETEDGYRRAIKKCKKAIALDPTFGNPYNDIGYYLLSLGEIDVVGWYEKAKNAPRSTNRLAPYVNLGYHYLNQGKPGRALAEFYCALKQNVWSISLVLKIRNLEESLGSEAVELIKKGSCYNPETPER
eukprot:TRINITY_DN6800_c0_g1_i1.p1 TRINITY_DN6800_c0_g1~~TRINITY_DN6800_c0_g1_i1.p1  ORF type:complete len:230 (-),score=37.89 TRINITY_DN6800_c0_g1_i1:110-718(-)